MTKQRMISEVEERIRRLQEDAIVSKLTTGIIHKTQSNPSYFSLHYHSIVTLVAVACPMVVEHSPHLQLSIYTFVPDQTSMLDVWSMNYRSIVSIIALC